MVPHGGDFLPCDGGLRLRKMRSMTNIATTTHDIAPHSIVVGVDDAASASQAIEWAVDEAKATGHRITLVHVVEPIGPNQRLWLARAGVSPIAVMRETCDAAQQLLDEIASALRERGVEVDVSVVEGEVRDALSALSATADRLVVGSHGRGPVTSRLLGSVGSSVVRDATCPTVVVRPATGSVRTPGVVVYAEATAAGQAALEAAFLEAEGRKCDLTVVAFDPDAAPSSGYWSIPVDRAERDEARLAVAEAVAGLQADHPDVAVSTLVADGGLLHTLLDLGGYKQLIVLERPSDDARHGRFSPRAALSAAVVEHADTTVMVVPPALEA